MPRPVRPALVRCPDALLSEASERPHTGVYGSICSSHEPIINPKLEYPKIRFFAHKFKGYFVRQDLMEIQF